MDIPILGTWMYIHVGNMDVHQCGEGDAGACMGWVGRWHGGGGGGGGG
jgi:hypothetical protein